MKVLIEYSAAPISEGVAILCLFEEMKTVLIITGDYSCSGTVYW